MLKSCKKALRISSSNVAFDDEIQDLIIAAKRDLNITGIIYIEEKDPLIKQDIIMYCKANFGLDNKDSEKYKNTYEILKNRLSLCGEYIE